MLSSIGFIPLAFSSLPSLMPLPASSLFRSTPCVPQGERAFLLLQRQAVYPMPHPGAHSGRRVSPTFHLPHQQRFQLISLASSPAVLSFIFGSTTSSFDLVVSVGPHGRPSPENESFRETSRNLRTSLLKIRSIVPWCMITSRKMNLPVSTASIFYS